MKYFTLLRLANHLTINVIEKTSGVNRVYICDFENDKSPLTQEHKNALGAMFPGVPHAKLFSNVCLPENHKSIFGPIKLPPKLTTQIDAEVVTATRKIREEVKERNENSRIHARQAVQKANGKKI